MLMLLSVVATSTLGACRFYGTGTNSTGLGCDHQDGHRNFDGKYCISDTTKCWGAEMDAAFNDGQNKMCGCIAGLGWHYARTAEDCDATTTNINQNAEYDGPEIKCYGAAGTKFMYYSSAEDCKVGVAKLNAMLVPHITNTPPPTPAPTPSTQVVHLGCHCPGGSGTCYPADVTKGFNYGHGYENHECWAGAMNEAFNDGEKLMFTCSGSGWHYSHYEANCKTTRDNINQHDQYKGGPEIKCRKATKYDHYLHYSSMEDCKAGVAKLNTIMPGRLHNMPVTTSQPATATTVVTTTTTTTAAETCSCPDDDDAVPPVCGYDGKSYRTFKHECEANCAGMIVEYKGECKTTKDTTQPTTTAQPATPPPTPETTQKTTQKTTRAQSTTTITAVAGKTTTLTSTTATTVTTRTFPLGTQAGFNLLLGSSIAAEDLTASELAALKAQVIAMLAKYTDLQTSDVVDVTVAGATGDRRHRSRSRRADTHQLTVGVLLGPETSYTELQAALTALKEKVLSGEVVLSGPEAESFSLIGVLPGQPVFPTTPVVTKTSIDSDATTTMTTTIPAATSTILSGKNSSTGGTSSGIDTDATTTIVPDASGAANTQKKGGGRGGIVGGVLGGVALFLVVFGAVMYRFVRGHSGESQQPYGQTTENPTYTTPENAAAPLAPQEDSTA